MVGDSSHVPDDLLLGMTRYHCIGGSVVPRMVRTGAENLSPSGFDPRAVQPVASRYTDYAVAVTIY